MKVLMLNGSPKPQSGNSGYLLELIKKRLPRDWEFCEYKIMQKSAYAAALEALAACDVIVLGFPLYVDSLPSHLLRFLTEAEVALGHRVQTKPVHVYTIINCGFFEGRQNGIAADIVKNWALRAGLTWGQVLMTGGGEMLGQTKSVPMGRGPNKNIHKALNVFTANITACQSGADICINPSFPRPLFIFMANRMWGIMLRKNGRKNKALYAR